MANEIAQLKCYRDIIFKIVFLSTFDDDFLLSVLYTLYIDSVKEVELHRSLIYSQKNCIHRKRKVIQYYDILPIVFGAFKIPNENKFQICYIA